ncbi:IS982 family transposase, partial [Lactobacillus crispatus]
MNCLKLKRFSHHLQVSFKDLVIICRHWYRLYAPAEFTHRRNIDQIKTTDSLILALLIWQAKTGIESQRRFCECFNCLSHSRFNRRSRQLLQLIYQIRQEMNKKVDLNS